MHECVKTLLKDEATTDEATFECLCKLLDTAGGTLTVIIFLNILYIIIK